MKGVVALFVLLAASCAVPRPVATPKPTPTPAPTAGPPRGGEPVVQNPPTTPDNAPTPIAGRANGQLPQADLVRVTPTCLAARGAAPSISRLLADAHAHGISLIASECYRPIGLQTQARTKACTGGNCACAGPPGHSNHGWGKAVDFRDANGPIVTVTNRSHLWLKANAARYGWNHPRWAEPGGSPCPEPWHWEWVGDGGMLHASVVRADVAAIVPDGGGYALCTALAEVIARGAETTVASSPAAPVSSLVVAASVSGHGLLAVDVAGGVHAFGEAHALSSGGGPVAGIASTPSGNGYWVVTTAGRVAAFGDARAVGSAPTSVVGIAATSTGNGYWLATSDGHVFAFGDGTPVAPAVPPPGAPVVGIAASPSGRGFWLVASDGGVFTFGGAPFLGSLASPRTPVVGMAAAPSGRGYWLATASGGVYAFGEAGL